MDRARRERASASIGKDESIGRCSRIVFAIPSHPHACSDRKTERKRGEEKKTRKRQPQLVENENRQRKLAYATPRPSQRLRGGWPLHLARETRHPRSGRRVKREREREGRFYETKILFLRARCNTPPPSNTPERDAVPNFRSPYPSSCFDPLAPRRRPCPPPPPRFRGGGSATFGDSAT